MRVAVTGAGGFVGRHVVAALADIPDVELMLVGRDTSKLAGMPGRHVALDVTAEPTADVFEQLGQPDRLIHLAWGGLTDFKSDSHVTDELPKHLRFLTALVEQGLEELTVTGTCLEYGLQEGALHEDLPTAPVTAYAEAKDKLHKALVALQAEVPFTLKWLRPFYMWGEGQNPKSFFSLLDAALERGDARFDMSGGEQVRDFLPVEYMGLLIAVAAMQDTIDGAINVGRGEGRTLRELAEERIAEHGSDMVLNLGVYPYPDYEPMRFWADMGKFNRIG
ncbi:MAG: NAD(P)-dependent oxidoreductase [Alphaproteobacteria bacterium]|nr:MAG: NAD(P)-dependent oxidoreductase [Alphaproteobacteria bacterium]